MTQLFSTLRLSAILLAMIGTAAHATPGTITPEQDDVVQQEQNGDDGFIEEDDSFQDDENQDDNYQGDNGQDGNWGDDQDNQDDQNDDLYDRGQDGVDQDDGYDDGYNDRGQGKNQDDGYRPGKPGRDQGKPRYDRRRPRRLVETVPVRQQFLGGARFPLYMMVNNLQRFRGYRLVNVVINGSSDAGMGMAAFCGSQCGPMQNVGYYINSYPIRTTGERVGPYSAQWFLEMRGNFWVDSIQLEFVR